MSAISMSMAIVSYAPPKSSMEFIKSEVERGLANGSISIEQIIQRPISATYLCWRERTKEINQAICKAFEAIVRNTKSGWGCV